MVVSRDNGSNTMWGEYAFPPNRGPRQDLRSLRETGLNNFSGIIQRGMLGILEDTEQSTHCPCARRWINPALGNDVHDSFITIEEQHAIPLQNVAGAVASYESSDDLETQ